MKKYKDFIISIAIVMGVQALVFFSVKLVLSDYNIMKSILSFNLIKEFVYIYDSWYPFIILSAFIIFKHDKENYFNLLLTMVLAAFLAHITFLIYPTMVTRPNIEVKSITDFILDITYKTDTPAANCLPSVHCIYCFIIMFYTLICKNLKPIYKIIINLYSILIVLSTLFIIQHIIT